MRRRPNPWFFVPVGLGVAMGAVLGWLITGVSCEDCALSQGLVATLGALVVGFGVGVVMVLAIRSMDEHRVRSAAGQPPPGVGCEVPEPE